MINIRNIKEWIMHLYQHIYKQLNLKLFKKFKWDKIFHKLGITVPIQVIIIMVNVYTYVNFAWPFSTLKNN